MSGAHMHLTYFPTEKDHPVGNFGDNNVVVRCASASSYQVVNLQFSMPHNAALAVRYLRELAAAATDLADQVQRKLEDATAEAVLSS